LGLGWIAYDGIRQANAALRSQSQEQARISARAIESLVARNVLALRVAASGRIEAPSPCERVQGSLSIAPGVAQRFELESAEGEPICEVGDVPETGSLPRLAPGGIAVGIDPEESQLLFRIGVIDGMATGSIQLNALRSASTDGAGPVTSLVLRQGDRQLAVINPDERGGQELTRSISEWPIANGQVTVRVGTPAPMITYEDQMIILLPVVMWFIAALMTWFMVTRLLIQPLRRLQRAVSQYEPGDPVLELPSKLGPATEIQALRDAFARAVTRVQESERDMTAALDGQRRLVREVHHRVKNNLQVIASLLNIHGRTAETPTARAAYGAIGRRVGALAIVHRHHYAEMEENRGIALRPLLTELAAELRAGAPESARGLMIDLEIEPLNTTQDVAVSTAFLVTEVVEFAMLHRPDKPVEISVQRTSELTGRLTLASPVLNPDEDGEHEKMQFERIISGLAKQLRSTLDRRLGRYSVDFPAFPPR
jgi:two-component sensor histidine kinase